jgi:hypothetical protein
MGLALIVMETLLEFVLIFLLLVQSDQRKLLQRLAKNGTSPKG